MGGPHFAWPMVYLCQGQEEMIEFLRAIRRRLKPEPPPGYISQIQCGSNTEFRGMVDKRAPESKISVGDDCLIECLLVTNTNQSEILIGNNVFIGGGTTIESACAIHIEDDVMISHHCLIQDSDNHSTRYSIRKKDTADWKNNRYHDWSVTKMSPVTIGKGAWIGANVIILKGVRVGMGSVVGAGAVVTKSVPDWVIAGGNPARTLREIPEDQR